jgi:hypothetical protein
MDDFIIIFLSVQIYEKKANKRFRGEKGITRAGQDSQETGGKGRGEEPHLVKNDK